MSNQIQFIQTTPEQLKKEIVQDLTHSLLTQLSKKFQPKEPTHYLTRNEVAEMLHIDLSTVYNWTKKGKLLSYGIGGRVYYKREEVDNAIIELKH